MRYSTVVLALAAGAFAAMAPAEYQPSGGESSPAQPEQHPASGQPAEIHPAGGSEECQYQYNECMAAHGNEMRCSCEATSCLGEDSARIRDHL